MERDVSEYFSYFTARGFVFERDYSKGTDSTCTQIYRLRKDAANYLEFRVLSAKERNVVVCVNGEKRFPDLKARYRGFIRSWRLHRLFSAERRDEWLLAVALLEHVAAESGSLFGIPLANA